MNQQELTVLNRRVFDLLRASAEFTVPDCIKNSAAYSRLSDNPHWRFGFTGFKASSMPASEHTTLMGQFLAGFKVPSRKYTSYEIQCRLVRKSSLNDRELLSALKYSFDELCAAVIAGEGIAQ